VTSLAGKSSVITGTLADGHVFVAVAAEFASRVTDGLRGLPLQGGAAVKARFLERGWNHERPDEGGPSRKDREHHEKPRDGLGETSQRNHDGRLLRDRTM
jgi:hypothetical protein